LSSSLDPPAERRRVIDPLELYASAIDSSDYVAALAPLIHSIVPEIGCLIDVGAGGGQLGSALADPALGWTAVEPSPSMRARLARLPSKPHVIAAGWQEAAVGPREHDTVLAATMPAFFDQPEAFLAHCRHWARRQVIWVVPAHAGPRGLCFAGCLPREWHREDETPAIEIVLRGLPAGQRPHQAAFTDWTFTGIVPDIAELAAYLADRLGWPDEDARRSQLAAHLSRQASRQASPRGAGFRLDIARRSAVLIWGQQ
jgi:hypothetical protein